MSIVYEILKKNAILLDNNLSTPITDFKVDIQLIDDAKPIFFKAYTLPFKLRDVVGAKIDRLCDYGILKPVRRSEWASPIVVVAKES
jgi:hypothetical protein